MLGAHIPVQGDDCIPYSLNRCCYPRCKTIDPVPPPLAMPTESYLLRTTIQKLSPTRQIEMLMKEF
jgi:hypothetical protein